MESPTTTSTPMTVEQCKNIATMVKRTPAALAARMAIKWKCCWLGYYIIIRVIAQFALLISTLGQHSLLPEIKLSSKSRDFSFFMDY